MRDELPTVRLALWRDDAIVLFDWLTHADLNSVPVSHPAQKQALADLHSRLEETLLPEDEVAAEVARAQDSVARDMGW
jgi:hypothetical protein